LRIDTQQRQNRISGFKLREVQAASAFQTMPLQVVQERRILDESLPKCVGLARYTNFERRTIRKPAS
jgi:hypothetical protein